MEIAQDQADKLKDLGAISIRDRFGGEYLLLQGQFFIVSTELKDKHTIDYELKPSS